MLRVGLTGGIASGKTTVCKMFSELGARVLDADEVAREVVQPGRPAWSRLREHFGPEFFYADGTIRRRLLRQHVFRDPEKRDLLNSIVHPEVQKEIARWTEELASREPEAVAIVDVPLLIEAGAAGRFDRVIVVFVSEEVQVERLVRRDKISEEEARQSLKAQLPLREKLPLADYVIDNSRSVEQTRSQVEAVWRELVR